MTSTASPGRTAALTLALTLPLVLAASAAHALTYQATGVIQDISDPFGVVAGRVSIGDAFSGVLTYDPSASPTTTSGSSSSYDWDPMGSDFFLSWSSRVISAQTTTTGLGRINIVDDGTPPDVLQAASQAISSVGASVFAVEVLLQDSTGTVFGSQALPTSIDVEDFDTYRLFSIGISEGGDVAVVYGLIQGWTLVPEPGSGALVLAGLSGLSRHGRRSRRAPC